MKKIIEILMKRDDLSYEEAKEKYMDCRAELIDAMNGTSCLSPEDVLLVELGLEIVYIFDFI